ncbi:MAG TPA: hypothetical protein VM052_08805 [Candidatus Limnocylindrales bacterium]|nr:hypothetical protein [Candidatus Limnocylindrales bacterium]
MRPELVPATDGANLLYFWAGYEGPGLAPVFVLDLLTLAVSDPSKPPHIPPEFEPIGKRTIVLRTDAQNFAFDVHRFRWDSKSAPLMAGVQEPISRTPIEITKLTDLTYGMLILQVFSPETQAVTRAFQLTSKRQLVELPAGHVTVIQDSDTPWYGVR